MQIQDDEPKHYFQRTTLPSFVLNKNNCVLLNLIEHISDKCVWGSKQYITLCLSLPGDVAIEIKFDEHLLEWFELNVESGVMCIDVVIKDFIGPLQFSPTKPRCHPQVSVVSIGLVISTDACKGLELAVHDVYPGVEHRECMRHLWKNMKKHYYGPLFSQNMWAAAKGFTIEKYKYHTGKIEEKTSDAIAWLDDNHPFVWSRSKFSEDSKVDYINNNLFECFNSWISKVKDHQIVDMLDKIRIMLITKFVDRFKVACNMVGTIIPSTIDELNARSKMIKGHEVLIVRGITAEVTVSTMRHAVNLDDKTCSCRAWQVTGLPCDHALSVIVKLSREVQMEEFVHEYYTVDKLTKTYGGVFKPMTSKHQWPQVNLGYKICKPKLRRKPGRPRVSRIKASDEVGTKKRRKCTECDELGHSAKFCQGGPTAREKKRRLSAFNASTVGGGDPSVTHASNESATASASDTGRGRGRGRGRRGRGRLAAWFRIE